MAPAFDISWVRAQFPGLHRCESGSPEAFFDGPGGTQVPQRVIDAVSGYLAGANANLHGAFRTSSETDAIVEEAHRAAADFLGCASDEVVFGPNMTTLAFKVAGAFRRLLGQGDEVVVTRLDHDANYSPWKTLEPLGVTVREVPFSPEDCTLDMDEFQAQLSDATRLVAVGYASNAVGTVNDLPRIVRAAHRVGARVFVDAVHYAPHGAIDVRELGCDLLACSAYKFFGPHQGLLYGRRALLESLPAHKVRPADPWLPGRLETGTQNHECMAGTTAAIEYLADLGRRCGGAAEGASRRAAVVAAMDAIRSYERSLGARLIAGLLRIEGLELYGIRDEARFDFRVPTVGIRVRGVSPRAVARLLGRRGLFVWDGNFYALNVTDDLGLERSGGLVRIGLAHYNTAGEVDRLLEALAWLAGAAR